MAKGKEKMKQRKKWKRLTLAEMEAFNKKGFEEAKREFDKKHGRLFSYQYTFKTARYTYKRKYSFADQIENALAELLGCYETGRLPARFSFGDGVYLSFCRRASQIVAAPNRVAFSCCFV